MKLAFMLCMLRPVFLELQVAIHPGSNHLQRDWVYCLVPDVPPPHFFFLGKCRWDSRHFWNCRACVCYSPVHGSHNKKGHVPYLCIRRTLEKYQVCIELQPLLFLSAKWRLVGIPGLVSAIIIIIIVVILHIRVMTSTSPLSLPCVQARLYEECTWLVM